MVLLFTLWAIRKESPPLKHTWQEAGRCGEVSSDRLRKMTLKYWRNGVNSRKWNSPKTGAKYYGTEGKSDVLTQAGPQLTLEVQRNANWKQGEIVAGFREFCMRAGPVRTLPTSVGCSVDWGPRAALLLLLRPPLFYMQKFSLCAESPTPQFDLACNILFSTFDFNLSARSFGIAPTSVCE